MSEPLIVHEDGSGPLAASEHPGGACAAPVLPSRGRSDECRPVRRDPLPVHPNEVMADGS